MTKDDEYQRVTVNALQRDGNGRKRGRAEMETAMETWGQYVYRLVGQVWTVCRTTAFGGFTSGPGEGYAMTANGAMPMHRENSWSTEDAYPTSRRRRGETPIPGEFPEDEDDFEDLGDARSAKRRQTGPGNEWVMVQHRESPASHGRASLPPQAQSRLKPTQSPRSFSANRPLAARRTRPSTARLSSTQAGSPYISHSRTASYTSGRPLESTPLKAEKRLDQSPVSDDVQKFTAKRQREERQNEASMRKINRQLKDLIREGQEALSTRIDIEDGSELIDMDEESFGRRSFWSSG